MSAVPPFLMPQSAKLVPLCGVPMVESNLKQALVFGNGRGISNPNGTAPGALLEKEGKVIVCLPGPPRESCLV